MSKTFPLSLGKTDEHYTPKEVFKSMGDIWFDMDVCSPVNTDFVSTPTNRFLTKTECGLSSEWSGFVWMNPPFGGRNGVVPWLEKFMSHGNGIALVNALTSSGWFHRFAPTMDIIFFPKGKTKFVQCDGTIAKSPQSGVVLMAIGEIGVSALEASQRNGFGIAYRQVKELD